MNKPLYHMYYVYDRIYKRTVVEYEAENGKEATEMFDRDGYKESTHHLFTLVNTQRARMTEDEETPTRILG